MSVDVINIAGLLFAVGVGWCLAWVAGLGALAEYARTNERGALIGLADLGSDVIAAVLTIAGGAALASLSAGLPERWRPQRGRGRSIAHDARHQPLVVARIGSHPFLSGDRLNEESQRPLRGI